MKEKKYSLETYNTDQLNLVFWDLMSDINEEEEAYGISWGGISPEKTELLHTNVDKDFKAPPPYYVLGANSMLAGMSSVPSGRHNCYSWAVAKLKSIGEQTINCDARIVDKVSDLVVAVTSWNLKNPKAPEPISESCCLM